MEETLNISTKLRLLRTSKNWSQEYVAGKVGLTQAAYAKLEAGKIRLTIERVKQLSELYSVEPDYFFSDQLSMTNHNSGTNSHANSIYYPKNYIDINYDSGNNVFEKILQENEKILNEKDMQLQFLNDALENAQMENERLLQLLEKITAKYQ